MQGCQEENNDQKEHWVKNMELGSKTWNWGQKHGIGVKIGVKNMELGQKHGIGVKKGVKKGLIHS